MSKTRAGFVCLLVAASGTAFGQTRAAYQEVSTAQVKSDRSKEWEDSVKKLVDINRRLKGDHWIALETQYGDSGAFLFSTARENLAAVESSDSGYEVTSKVCSLQSRLIEPREKTCNKLVSTRACE